MGVTLERVQNKFACIIGELCSEPAVLSKFAIWLDLRLAEYKSKGSISLDCSGENPDPFWLNGHEKEETRETPGGESLGDYHYTPTTVPRHPSHSPIHRFPPPGGTSTILPESASKDSMSSGQAAFKKESVTDDQNDVFPVSLHRVETSQERKRSAAEPISKSHESFPSLYPSKVSRIADDMSSALVDQAMGTDTGFTKSYLQGSDDDFDSSNDDTDTEFNSALARSQAGVSSLPKGDNSLTFSSQNSVSVDDSSLQHRLSFQSNTSDPSNLSQDVGSNSGSSQSQVNNPEDVSKAESLSLPSQPNEATGSACSVVKNDNSSVPQGESQTDRIFPNVGAFGGKVTHISTIPLPNFSSRVVTAMKHKQPFMGIMVQETAYHILMYVDIGSKTEYEELGRRMYAAFPCIERPGTYPWTSFCKKLSQKIRNIRWRQQKTYPKGAA